MIITDIRVDTKAAPTLAARIEWERGGSFEVEYVVPEGRAEWLSRTGDPFLPLTLLPAMARGEDVRIDATVSSRLLAHVPTIKDIYRAWKGGLRDARLVAPRAAGASSGSGVALFFSGGVDSFYSLLKNLEQHPNDDETVSHLVLIYGFDIRPRNPGLFRQILDRARRVARVAGKELVVVETNLRVFSDPLVGWDLYHGAALASVGLALGGLVKRCLIASTHAYPELIPWGSHPLLDPLWSTDAVEFLHDGCEALRTEKIRQISRSTLALEHLRVCWPDWAQEYNCGQCEKCVRTMIALRIAGALERCPTFTRPLRVKTVRKVRLVTGESSIRFMEDLLASLGHSAEERRLAAAIKHVIWRTRVRAKVGLAARRYLGPNATLAGVRRMILGAREASPALAVATTGTAPDARA